GMQEAVQLKFNNIRLKEQLAARLSQQLMVDSVQFINLMNDAEFLKRYDMTPETVIAMFIPNTYEVYWTLTAEKLFDRMFKEYKRFWTEERLAKAQAANLTPVEVSILASIVDEETNIAKDKPIIAGLYLNRIRKGMPLQACPTVKFALGDFTLTRILTEHTRINSPYNTYKYRGLPPGPIRMASIAGIDAVLNHTKSNYIYMCAKETLNGEHSFATTLAEHNKNTQRYHRAYRQWERDRKNKN
ncbi:MAG TPA: endolytic transglycosylase MltG, partial [Paludibacteraceae bacterium]|nr:endolytic transglycosylase MltG [Paludibacteraceae bacterium]